MSFRKENKYKVTLSDMLNLNSILHERGMKKLYPKRQINSCYFDDDQFTLFNQSEEGVLPRKKIRVRWYENQRSFSLEKKTSSQEGRYKTTDNLQKLNFEPQVMKLDLFDNNYGSVYPLLKVSYKRSYFSFEGMRITLDEHITYKNLRSKDTRILIDPERVIEVKVPDYCSTDFIETYIPYQTSRFSKYSRGLLLSMGEICEL